MKDVVADKGYITNDNLQIAVGHGATSYIPFKTNVTENAAPSFGNFVINTVSTTTSL